MQAFFINATARTVTPFEFSGKPQDAADILHTDVSQVVGAGLSDGKTPDVLLLSYQPEESAPFFLIAGLPVPLKGNGLVVGMNEVKNFGNRSGGSVRETPTVSLEWLLANIIWLREVRQGESAHKDGMAGFEVIEDEQHPDAIKNVLCGLAEMQESGAVKCMGGKPGEAMTEMTGDALREVITGTTSFTRH